MKTDKMLEKHCGDFKASCRMNNMADGYELPKSDCHFRCGSNEETPAGEDEFGKEMMQKRRTHKPEKIIKGEFNAKLEAGGKRSYNRAGKVDMQAGGTKIQKTRSKAIHSHKIHVYESRPKPNPIHRLIFKVV